MLALVWTTILMYVLPRIAEVKGLQHHIQTLVAMRLHGFSTQTGMETPSSQYLPLKWLILQV
jgi:hypothetical protein